MDDDGVQGNESVADGIFEEVAATNHEVYKGRGQLDKAANDPAATGQTGGGTPTKEKPNTNKSEEEDEGDNANGLDTQDFSREEAPETTEDEVSTEPDETTKTETTPVVDEDWKAQLPPDPGEFTLQPPKPDEYNQIDPVEYADYIRAQIRHDNKVEEYNTRLVTTTFDTVDKILPEIKDDPALQEAIRNTYYGTLSGEQTVNLAKSLRSSLDRVASKNKSAGIQSAKTSITIQKNASVETKGATQKKAAPSRTDNLAKRLQKNDTSAFEELMGDWMEDGKI